MINCPKCGFQQPPDQYCASCGIDMQRFKPTPTPAYQKVLSSWMFQLGILIVFIFALVIYDGESEPTPSSTNVATTATLTQSAQENAEAALLEETREMESSTPTVANETEAATSSAKPTESLRAASIQSPKAIEREQGPTPKAVVITFYSIETQSLANLQKDLGENIRFSGGIMSGIIPAKSLQSSLRNNNAETLMNKRYRGYNPDQPIQLLAGKKSEAGTERGLQLSIQLDSNATTDSLGMKAELWSTIVENDGDVSLFNSDIRLQAGQVAFFSQFAPRLDLTETDIEWMTSDRVLSAIASPDFLDEATEIIMTIELRE